MSDFVDCAHCGKTGVCSNGADGCSCAVCVSPSFMRTYPAGSKGLVCTVCEGRGVVDPTSVKLPHRFFPYFSAGIVLGLLALLLVSLLIRDGSGFDKAVGFSGAILGTIVGYFFGGNKK